MREGKGLEKNPQSNESTEHGLEKNAAIDINKNTGI